jgi:hypothetical protein
MGTNDRAIDKVEVPVHPTGLVGPLLQPGQDAVPDTGRTPAIDPTGDRFVAAVALGQILPRCPGAQNPLDAIDDWTMVVIGPSGSWFPGRQQGQKSRPLLVG